MSVTGKLAYHLYYKPLFWLNKFRKAGGVVNSIRISNGKSDMAKAAFQLKTSPVNDAVNVYFLTGKKYWPLTAFCMYSLAKASTIAIKPVFIDDGSFDDDLITQMKSQFPGCDVKTTDEIAKNIQEKLPASKYPVINKKREDYPHIRKLTDIHTISNGWKLVLDSDMLFFKTPVQLQEWLITPTKPLFLYDPITSYYYSEKLMGQLAGSTVKPNLNVGAIGLKSEAIDWDKLEEWITALENDSGECYLLEQALSAMLVAGQNITVADPKEYIVMPDEQQINKPTATLYHYVDQSRNGYYTTAWRKVV
jgi:hypothetical protein